MQEGARAGVSSAICSIPPTGAGRGGVGARESLWRGCLWQTAGGDGERPPQRPCPAAVMLWCWQQAERGRCGGAVQACRHGRAEAEVAGTDSRQLLAGRAGNEHINRASDTVLTLSGIMRGRHVCGSSRDAIELCRRRRQRGVHARAGACACGLPGACATGRRRCDSRRVHQKRSTVRPRSFRRDTARQAHRHRHPLSFTPHTLSFTPHTPCQSPPHTRSRTGSPLEPDLHPRHLGYPSHVLPRVGLDHAELAVLRHSAHSGGGGRGGEAWKVTGQTSVTGSLFSLRSQPRYTAQCCASIRGRA